MKRKKRAVRKFWPNDKFT